MDSSNQSNKSNSCTLEKYVYRDLQVSNIVKSGSKNKILSYFKVYYLNQRNIVHLLDGGVQNESFASHMSVKSQKLVFSFSWKLIMSLYKVTVIDILSTFLWQDGLIYVTVKIHFFSIHLTNHEQTVINYFIFLFISGWIIWLCSCEII